MTTTTTLARALADAFETAKRDNAEWHAGKQARRDGVPISDCPYLDGGTRAARWRLGWKEGAPDGE